MTAIPLNLDRDDQNCASCTSFFLARSKVWLLHALHASARPSMPDVAECLGSVRACSDSLPNFRTRFFKVNRKPRTTYSRTQAGNSQSLPKVSVRRFTTQIVAVREERIIRGFQSLLDCGNS